jgi:hypothetical protein
MWIPLGHVPCFSCPASFTTVHRSAQDGKGF